MAIRGLGRASILMVGKLSMTASQGLILVVLARLEGAAAVGLYTLALAIVPSFPHGAHEDAGCHRDPP